MRKPGTSYYIYADQGAGFKLAHGNLSSREQAMAEAMRLGTKFPVKVFAQMIYHVDINDD